MAKLLKKEFALFAHPTSWMFLAFGAMMLIPGYPMYLPIFFSSLGLFYACLAAREARLPIAASFTFKTPSAPFSACSTSMPYCIRSRLAISAL